MSLRKSQADHWKGKSKEIIVSYFESPPAIKRSLWFVEQLKNYDFDSIFEVGYFASRNLFYLQQAFPDVKISGLEINPSAVRYARIKMNMDKELLCMDLHQMHQIQDTFDVVFSSGVLIHVPTDDIPGVVRKMLNLSNRYVMHIEHNGNNEVVAGPKHMNPTYKESGQIQFAPDLIGTYKQLGYSPTIIPLPENCKTNGAKELLIIDKGQV